MNVIHRVTIILVVLCRLLPAAEVERADVQKEVFAFQTLALTPAQSNRPGGNGRASLGARWTARQSQLTVKQMQVFRLRYSGLSINQTAKKLGVSIAHVNHTAKVILKKLGIKDVAIPELREYISIEDMALALSKVSIPSLAAIGDSLIAVDVMWKLFVYQSDVAVSDLDMKNNVDLPLMEQMSRGIHDEARLADELKISVSLLREAAQRIWDRTTLRMANSSKTGGSSSPSPRLMRFRTRLLQMDPKSFSELTPREAEAIAIVLSSDEGDRVIAKSLHLQTQSYKNLLKEAWMSLNDAARRYAESDTILTREIESVIENPGPALGRSA